MIADVSCVVVEREKTTTLLSAELLQSTVSPQSPNAGPSASVEQTRKEPTGHCSREVQVPPTPTANHNQEESVEETYGSSRMYLSG